MCRARFGAQSYSFAPTIASQSIYADMICGMDHVADSRALESRVAHQCSLINESVYELCYKIVDAGTEVDNKRHVSYICCLQAQNSHGVIIIST